MELCLGLQTKKERLCLTLARDMHVPVCVRVCVGVKERGTDKEREREREMGFERKGTSQGGTCCNLLKTCKGIVGSAQKVG